MLAACEGCGRSSAVAELMLYGGGLGVVLRCPGCADVAIRIVRLPDRDVVQVRGSWSIELPRP